MNCNCLYQNEDRKTVNGITEVYCQGCGKHLYDEDPNFTPVDYEQVLLENEIAEVELDLSFALSEGRDYSTIDLLTERLEELNAKLEDLLEE